MYKLASKIATDMSIIYFQRQGCMIADNSGQSYEIIHI